MSFHFSPTNKNRLKNFRKSFNSSNFLTSRGETANTQTQQKSLKFKLSNALTNSTNNNINNNNTNTKTNNLNQSVSSSTMMPSVKSRLIKNISRTKEKILQGMGKTDRTSDESFDLYVDNFEAQHAQATKLNKELHKYLSCLRETQKSSKTFYETLRETFEPTWPMSNQFGEQIENIEVKWNDYLSKLHKDVQLPLMSYLNEFPELKKKIEKRCNRLLDYDNARHNLENAQNKTIKKNLSQTNHTINTSSTNNNNTSGGSSSSSSSTSNPMTTQTSTDQLTKLTKLKIDLEDKQHIYEEINQTLCLALPVLYENRIKFYSSLFQTFFHTETIFHSECVESKSKLDEICENLSLKTNSQFMPASHSDQSNSSGEGSTILAKNIPSIDCEYEPHDNDTIQNGHQNHTNGEYTTSEFAPKADLNSSDEDLDAERKPQTNNNNNNNNINNTSSLYSMLASQISQVEKVNSPNQEKKPRVLYKVKATYPYDAKEVDELTFAKDDLIDVVDGTESEKEDLDDGWLIGVHELTNKRGLFPENFTKRI